MYFTINLLSRHLWKRFVVMTLMEGQDPYLALCRPPMFASSLLARVCASSEGNGVAARKLDIADSHKDYSERHE